jgi:hypothetical protein
MMEKMLFLFRKSVRDSKGIFIHVFLPIFHKNLQIIKREESSYTCGKRAEGHSKPYSFMYRLQYKWIAYFWYYVIRDEPR